jgi:hypothetical protein
VGISIYQDTRHLPVSGQIGQIVLRQWTKDFAQMGACTLTTQNFYERLNFESTDKVNSLKTKLLQIAPDPRSLAPLTVCGSTLMLSFRPRAPLSNVPSGWQM